MIYLRLIQLRLKKNRSAYVGFQCYIVFSNNEIYGPFIPDQASPSDSSMPSRHAEVRAIKYLKSIKRPLKNATLYSIHWVYNISKQEWEISDGIPCKDCCKFIQQNGISKLGVSCKSTKSIIDVDYSFIKSQTRPSTGRLYGK